MGREGHEVNEYCPLDLAGMKEEREDPGPCSLSSDFLLCDGGRVSGEFPSLSSTTSLPPLWEILEKGGVLVSTISRVCLRTRSPEGRYRPHCSTVLSPVVSPGSLLG